jgi:hypothetical protein
MVSAPTFPFPCLLTATVWVCASRLPTITIHCNRIKDPYDIYSILVSVDRIDQLLSSWTSRNPFIAESIELLKTSFASETSAGPTGAADYLTESPSERAEYAARVFTSVNSVLRKIA